MTEISVEPEVCVPLLSRRRERGQLLQKLQHAVPAGVLLFAGARALLGHPRGFALTLALGEIAFGALLLRALFREARDTLAGDHEPAAHHGPSWTEILAAGVLAAEAAEHWHSTGHLPRPTVLLAAVTLGLGLFHGRIAERAQSRRSLRVDEHGVRVRRRWLRTFDAPWGEIEELALAPALATIRARGLRVHRIDLLDLRNAAEVRAALETAVERLERRRAQCAANAPQPPRAS